MTETLVMVLLSLFLWAVITSPKELHAKRVDQHTIVVTQGDKTAIYKEVK